MNPLDLNIEERLWGIGTYPTQHMIAWRMFEEGEDFLYQGNMRVYEDVLMTVTEEQFLT